MDKDKKHDAYMNVNLYYILSTFSKNLARYATLTTTKI
jgi:hypothetical protein